MQPRDCGCDNGGAVSTSLTTSSIDAGDFASLHGAGASLDASRPQFRVGNSSSFSELLHAITMIRGTPVQGNVVSSSSTELLVQGNPSVTAGG